MLNENILFDQNEKIDEKIIRKIEYERIFVILTNAKSKITKTKNNLSIYRIVKKKLNLILLNCEEKYDKLVFLIEENAQLKMTQRTIICQLLKKMLKSILNEIRSLRKKR